MTGTFKQKLNELQQKDNRSKVLLANSFGVSEETIKRATAGESVSATDALRIQRGLRVYAATKPIVRRTTSKAGTVDSVYVVGVAAPSKTKLSVSKIKEISKAVFS